MEVEEIAVVAAVVNEVRAAVCLREVNGFDTVDVTTVSAVVVDCVVVTAPPSFAHADSNNAVSTPIIHHPFFTKPPLSQTKRLIKKRRYRYAIPCGYNTDTSESCICLVILRIPDLAHIGASAENIRIVFLGCDNRHRFFLCLLRLAEHKQIQQHGSAADQ